MYEHFSESERILASWQGDFDERLTELYTLLEDYYSENWLLDIDFDDEEFWPLFRELYERAKT